jgi:hypothetical protein
MLQEHSLRGKCGFLRLKEVVCCDRQCEGVEYHGYEVKGPGRQETVWVRRSDHATEMFIRTDVV